SLALLVGVFLVSTSAEARRGGGGRRSSKSSSSYYKAAATAGAVTTGAAIAASSAKHKKSQGYRATARLNVRAEPSNDAIILGKIAKGTRIAIESSTYPNFYQINYKNQRGFVSKHYVK
ncbi:MAG: SH3 domain-containing protein, partial [Enterovibrio sp.]